MPLHPLDRIWPLFAPLSRASGPLRVGLTRRQLQQQGVEMCTALINGVQVNFYTRRGEAIKSPLLFVHGLGDSALTWAMMFSLLPGYSIYAIDLPGYGLSPLPRGQTYATIGEMRDVLATFVEEVIGQPAVVIGNSMGGWLAVELARAAATTTRGLVLINPGGALLGGHDSYNEFRTLLAVTDLVSARLVLRRMFGTVPRPLLYVSQSALQATFQRVVVRDFMNAVTEAEFLQAEDLRAVEVPVQLVWGETDAFLPAGSFDFFRDNLPNAAVHVLPGIGHLPQTELPHEVAAIVARFTAQA